MEYRVGDIVTCDSKPWNHILKIVSEHGAMFQALHIAVGETTGDLVAYGDKGYDMDSQDLERSGYRLANMTDSQFQCLWNLAEKR